MPRPAFLAPAALVLLAGPAAARAGTVVVETAVAAEVTLEGRPVVQTFGPAVVSLPDVPGGRRVFVVWRSGRSEPLAVQVPEEGRVRLLVGADSLGTDQAPPVPADAPPPTVELRAATGSSFSLILDGRPFALLASEHPLRLEDLPPGEHALEIRSADRTVVWARGTLDLQPGDALILHVAEGRMPEVFGRPGAWTPKG